MRFKLLGIGIILSLGVFFGSCTKEEPLKAPEANSSENLQLKNASTPTAHTEDVFCDLIAGQSDYAGQVIISHDDDNIYVQYLTSGGWTLSEVHLYIGTADGVPHNKKAIQIGQFPYSTSDLVGNTITVPIGELPDEPTEGYAVFAHAIVMNGDRQETAWSNGCAYKPLITVKSWFKDSWWAASSGNRFSNNASDWCYYLGTNIYSGADSYSFQSDNPSMANAGQIKVSDNGTQLFVDVYANTDDGYKLARTYVYVGNKQELQSYVSGNCPLYENFPDKNLIEADVHSFIFPLTTLTSVSFNTTQFGANRWGWFFYYPIN